MKNIKKKIIKLLDNEIIANIVRAFILLFPVIVWIIASIITSKF